MSNLYQTNASTSKTIKRSLSEARIQLSFTVKETSPNVYPTFVEGEQVVLDVAGLAIPRTASTDVVVGVVVVPNKNSNLNQITVAMHGNIVQAMGATGGAIAVGDRIVSVGMNTSVTPNRPNAAVAVSGEYADGIALTAASLDSEVTVLVYASPVLIP